VTEEVLGEHSVEGVRARNVGTGRRSTLDVEGVFVAIGAAPASGLFEGQVEPDEGGYVVRKENTTTSVPGVFSAGEVSDERFRWIATAAGDGCKAALEAKAFSENRGQGLCPPGAGVASEVPVGLPGRPVAPPKVSSHPPLSSGGDARSPPASARPPPPATAPWCVLDSRAEDDEETVDASEARRRTPVDFLTRRLPAQVARYLRGIRFPAQKEELLKTLESNGVPGPVLSQLRNRLPEREYRGPQDVLDALRRGGR
jgi:hypothetical protein